MELKDGDAGEMKCQCGICAAVDSMEEHSPSSEILSLVVGHDVVQRFVLRDVHVITLITLAFEVVHHLERNDPDCPEVLVHVA